MENATVTDKDREMARVCLECPCGKMARLEQQGWLYECVKNFGEAMCPFGQAYEKVYGRKAHEPVSTL